LDTGRLGVFLRQYRAAIRVVVLAGAALWYLSIDHPTGNTALWFVVGVVGVLLITELLAAPPADPPSKELASDPGSKQ
jgi:hypothetical protein